MGMRRRIPLFLWFIGTGAAIGLILFLQAGIAASLSQTEHPSCNSFGIQRFQERKEAPAFCLKSLTGERVNLSDFRGKPVLVTFWATWCASCKEEIPELERFSIGKTDQLTILLIAIDGERKGAVRNIVGQKKITLPVLLLLKEKVMEEYGVRGWIPLTFLVDREGRLVGKIVGQRDWGTPEAWSCLKELFELR
jgi:peroxiredoxin